MKVLARPEVFYLLRTSRTIAVAGTKHLFCLVVWRCRVLRLDIAQAGQRDDRSF